jgi:hypothetical protein
MDCYVLSLSAHAIDACYRCNDGRCEPHGSLVTKRLDSLANKADHLNAVAGPNHTTLLAAASDESVQGWRLTGDAEITGLGAVSYSMTGEQAGPDSACPVYQNGRLADASCLLRDHVTAWASPKLMLGVSINVQGCDAGQVRMGLADVATPLQLDSNSAHGTLAGGVAVTDQRCTGPSGARSPAVAALTHDADREAYAVWLAAAAYGHDVPRPDRCAAVGFGSVAIEGMRLTIHDDADQAAWIAADDADGNPSELGRGLGSDVPQLISTNTAAFAGYLLAFVDDGGVRLMPLRAFGAANAAPVLVEPDPAANQIALSLGSATASSQDFLLAWTSGCGPAQQLRVAVYRWSASQLVRITSSLTLVADIDVTGAPVAAYSPTGFGLRPPTGGWSVVWQEQGSNEALHASRIAEADHVPEPPQTLVVGSIGLPFVHAAKSAPFSYGFASGDVDTHTDDLMLLTCE